MASKINPNVKFKLFGDQNISEPELKKTGLMVNIFDKKIIIDKIMLYLIIIFLGIINVLVLYLKNQIDRMKLYLNKLGYIVLQFHIL